MTLPTHPTDPLQPTQPDASASADDLPADAGGSSSGHVPPAPHLLTVSTCSSCGEPEEPACPNGLHLWEDPQITCPGLQEGQCRGWQECAHTDCPVHYLDPARHRNLGPDGGTAAELHGVPHQVVNGMWMRATDHCYVQTSDDLPDAVQDLELTAPGTYEVDQDDDGYGGLRLALLQPASQQAARKQAP